MDGEQLDTTTKQTEVQQPPLPKKQRNIFKKFVTFLLILVLLAAAALGGYLWRDQEARSELSTKTTQIESLQSQITDLQSKVETAKAADGSVCVVTRPSDNTLANIRASITSGNTAALEGYMAPSVNVIYAASDGLGQRTAANAVSDVTSFISKPAGATWSFDVATATLNSYSQGSYKQYFPATALVAQASDDRLLSISFDCDSKISTILLVMNEDSLQ